MNLIHEYVITKCGASSHIVIIDIRIVQIFYHYCQTLIEYRVHNTNQLPRAQCAQE